MIHPFQLKLQFGAYLWHCSMVKRETATKCLERKDFPRLGVPNFPLWKENPKLTFELFYMTIINNKNDPEQGFKKEQTFKLFKLNCENTEGNPGELRCVGICCIYLWTVPSIIGADWCLEKLHLTLNSALIRGTVKYIKRRYLLTSADYIECNY